jgi:hypothetical protein
VLGAVSVSVISSAVAIPSAGGLAPETREFVIYESALSDIVGIIVFYAWLESHGLVTRFAGVLFSSMAVSLVAAALAGLGLLYLINRLEGHVRFLPLLAGLTLLYATAKSLHLSPLVLVLVCGLLLNNTHLLHGLGPLARLIRPGYDETLEDFKSLVAELTFAVKSFFFLMLGYWTDIASMTDPRAWGVAGAALAIIYLPRFGLLRLVGQPDPRRLLWLAPRGLITVLLFLTAMTTPGFETFPFGAIMLIVLATATLTALAHRGDASDTSATRTDAVDRPGHAAAGTEARETSGTT